ncbi:MAG TPA: LuxR C-terminal-related transcriptional regulator [Trebonia sp.]|jgi:LuxR family maltose regulon positive regulatory protein|nr:LuxR C-terminal-related transcriptional regulator [Trebonia sp.]
MAARAPVLAVASSQSRLPGVDDIILASKITSPGLPGWMVSRSRLDARIQAGTQGPLTMLIGPPGAGKTMAIASWMAASTEAFSIAWVNLDQYDSHPRAFWSYVVAALRGAGVDIPKTVWSSARGRAVDHGFVLRLTAAVTAHRSPVVLVLDDLHLITDQRSLTGLAQLLRHASPRLRLVAASRLDPLLPLHRYRLAGELTEIRADELAFSASETSLLIEQHGVGLPADSVEFLAARTGGWAAALRLAAISMADHPDPAQLVKEVAAADGPVAGYLVDEVLSTLSDDVRELLLRTSILDRVSAGLAGALIDDELVIDLGSVALANAFVKPLGGGWYRYHPLVTEVLRLRLRRQSPDLAPQLHRRAAQWHRRHGTLAEAAGQAQAAGDWQLAARIAVDELAVSQLTTPYASEPLAEVLRQMPRDPAWTEPQPLLVTAAIDLAAAHPDAEAAGASLTIADGMLAGTSLDEQLPSRLTQATLSLVLARSIGDHRTAEAAAANAAAILDRIPADELVQHPEARAQVLTGLGSVQFWSGQFDQAAATLTAAEKAAPGSDQHAEILGQLALVEVLGGHLSRGADLAAQAAGLGRNPGVGAEIRASSAALVALAWAHVERYELSEARGWLRLADRALQLRPDRLIGALACLASARGCLAESRGNPVPALVSRTLQGWSAPPWLERRLRLVESRALAATGQIPAAVEAARRAGADHCGAAAAALAVAWLTAGDVPAARQALADGPAQGPEHRGIEGWLIAARIAQLTGDGDRSRHCLERALRLAEPEQWRLPFVLHQEWLRPEMKRHPGLARAGRQLLGPTLVARGGPSTPVPAAGRQPQLVPAQGLRSGPEVPLVVDELSDREREVLRHVSQLLGTAEIAAEMFVSVNTVKSHLKSSFRKLGAASRNEAVRRARQLHQI